MATNLIYMPTFRVRQQENIVLRSFEFGEHMFPLLEIVKEFDRKREGEKQPLFDEIHLGLINDICDVYACASAQRVESPATFRILVMRKRFLK